MFFKNLFPFFLQWEWTYWLPTEENIMVGAQHLQLNNVNLLWAFCSHLALCWADHYKLIKASKWWNRSQWFMWRTKPPLLGGLYLLFTWKTPPSENCMNRLVAHWKYSNKIKAMCYKRKPKRRCDRYILLIFMLHYRRSPHPSECMERPFHPSLFAHTPDLLQWGSRRVSDNTWVAR